MKAEPFDYLSTDMCQIDKDSNSQTWQDATRRDHWYGVETQAVWKAQLHLFH